jgi:hypothetical protein
MNIVSLIISLHKSFILADSLEVQILHIQQATDTNATGYWKSVTLQHNTITLKLYQKQTGVKQKMAPIFIEAKFNIEDKTCTLSSFYCENAIIQEKLKSFVLDNAPKTFDTTINTTISPFNEETLKYLAMADEIAKESYLCSSEDSYHPGYYTDIILEETQIVLKQINRTNARSVNHKQDYYMRDLIFYIPTTAIDLTPSYSDIKIGRMSVQFSDNSTPNNKKCGNRIKEKINEVINNFKLN